MIRVSNLRKERITQTNECRIVCDIECSFSNATQLWFSVPEMFSDWLTDDVYDAFMVAMLFPAMYYKQDLYIDGCVSEKRIMCSIVSGHTFHIFMKLMSR